MRTSQDESESVHDRAHGQDGSSLHKENPSDDVKVNLNFQNQDISAAISASTIDTDNDTVNNMNHLMIRAYGKRLVGIGDVRNSDDWYNWWERILLLGRQHYDISRGAVGCKYLEMVYIKLQYLSIGNIPADVIIVFHALILQQDRMVRKAIDIRRVLERRLRSWGNGEFDSLMEEVIHCDKMLSGHLKYYHDEEHIICMFTRLMSM